MILDIDKWKDELGFQKGKLSDACDANDEFQIEKTLYYIAISIRKMLDNRLCPQSLSSRQVNISRYSPSNGTIDALNYLDADSHYDFTSPSASQCDIKRVVDILIHSSFLDWRTTDQRTVEFLMSSDREKTAIGISLDQFLKLMDYVLNSQFKNFPLPTVRRTS